VGHAPARPLHPLGKRGWGLKNPSKKGDGEEKKTPPREKTVKSTGEGAPTKKKTSLGGRGTQVTVAQRGKEGVRGGSTGPIKERRNLECTWALPWSMRALTSLWGR